MLKTAHCFPGFYRLVGSHEARVRDALFLRGALYKGYQEWHYQGGGRGVPEESERCSAVEEAHGQNRGGH